MWRPMKNVDLKKVYTISLAQWGSDNYESIHIFEDKLRRFPEGCFVYESNNKVQGYVFSHPWNSKIIPILNQRLPNINPETFDSYFIHDIVLVPELRGLGIASKILYQLIHNKTVYIIAPLPTHHYWKKHYQFKKTNIKYDYGIYMVREPYENEMTMIL
jgi:ribosomal protein S18 acetylase RimI-like enzyme